MLTPRETYMSQDWRLPVLPLHHPPAACARNIQPSYRTEWNVNGTHLPADRRIASPCITRSSRRNPPFCLLHIYTYWYDQIEKAPCIRFVSSQRLEYGPRQISIRHMCKCSSVQGTDCRVFCIARVFLQRKSCFSPETVSRRTNYTRRERSYIQWCQLFDNAQG